MLEEGVRGVSIVRRLLRMLCVRYILVIVSVNTKTRPVTLWPTNEIRQFATLFVFLFTRHSLSITRHRCCTALIPPYLDLLLAAAVPILH